MEFLLPDGVKDDIIFSILLKVPLKSLIRFRCVSNSWSNLITNPNFLRMQSSYQHNNLNFIFVGEHPSTINHLYSIAYNPSSSLPSSYDKPIKLSSQFLDNGFEIIGSCNGLLCIETYSHEFVILNPFTTEFKQIPSPTKFQDEEQFPQESALSYDPVIDDYLLVRVVKFPSLSDSKVQVYTLRSNSWRTIQFDVVSNLILERYRFDVVVCVYGSLYWSTKDFLHSFNVSNEKINKIPLPADWSGSTLCVIGEWPCLSRGIINNTINLLLRKKYGVDESWIELSLNYIPYFFENMGTILFFENMGTILIALFNEKYSLIYDSEQERLRLLKVPFTPKMYPEGTYARSTATLNSGTYMSTEVFDEGTTLSED